MALEWLSTSLIWAPAAMDAAVRRSVCAAIDDSELWMFSDSCRRRSELSSMVSSFSCADLDVLDRSFTSLSVLCLNASALHERTEKITA
jgi:hypothetical protein